MKKREKPWENRKSSSNKGHVKNKLLDSSNEDSKDGVEGGGERMAEEGSNDMTTSNMEEDDSAANSGDEILILVEEDFEGDFFWFSDNI